MQSSSFNATSTVSSSSLLGSKDGLSSHAGETVEHGGTGGLRFTRLQGQPRLHWSQGAWELLYCGRARDHTIWDNHMAHTPWPDGIVGEMKARGHDNSKVVLRCCGLTALPCLWAFHNTSECCLSFWYTWERQFRNLLCTHLMTCVLQGVTFCGDSKASSITMKNVPWHEEVLIQYRISYRYDP